MTKKGGKGRQTAQEFKAELQADPAYLKMRAEKEARMAALEERSRLAERPVIADLHAVGVKVASVWDLVNTRASYEAAIPVLLDHLQKDHPDYVREPIARALAVRDASWAWDVLLSLFEREPVGGRHNVKWALACALSGAATDDELDKLVELVRDPSLGENRLALLSALARSKDPRARAVLEELRVDPQLAREIRVLIGRPRSR